MLTLRKLLLEDADAESECCSFLERSSNKNSSCGAWSCTIVVSFTANTEPKQKKKNRKYIICKTSNYFVAGVMQHNLILALKALPLMIYGVCYKSASVSIALKCNCLIP